MGIPLDTNRRVAVIPAWGAGIRRRVGRVRPQGRNPTLGDVWLRYAKPTSMPPGGRTDLSRLRQGTGDGGTFFMFRGGETRHDRLIGRGERKKHHADDSREQEQRTANDGRHDHCSAIPGPVIRGLSILA